MPCCAGAVRPLVDAIHTIARARARRSVGPDGQLEPAIEDLEETQAAAETKAESATPEAAKEKRARTARSGSCRTTLPVERIRRARAFRLRQPMPREGIEIDGSPTVLVLADDRN
jgi:hypothetical protein